MGLDCGSRPPWMGEVQKMQEQFSALPQTGEESTQQHRPAEN